ncbi:DNA polymerase [Photobacterium toruni]|uniref:DNA polymerase I n=1 Tax=Photobacterium toruni TaxID=1935446 RepID=A0A1T4T5U7_9GAMM|nr:DNA polymerase [Photobacterium toruni]SKA35910.1 DNA polymerase I [Photobacterium toruni]
MSLSPALQQRFQRAKPATTTRTILPVERYCYTKDITIINDDKKLQEWIDAISQCPISAVCIDFEFNFTKPPIILPQGDKADIRSVKPLLMSITVLSDTKLITAVIDLTAPLELTLLQALLSFPTTYIAHNAKAELQCIWQLGLVEPAIWWDTLIAERAIYLGKHHSKSTGENGDETLLQYSLDKVAARYGLEHKFAQTKQAMQQSFLQDDLTVFTAEQHDYAAEDTIIGAQLYCAQKQKTMIQGIGHHLMTVEMPWVTVNAEMEWTGVAVNRALCNRVLEQGTKKLDLLRHKLQASGLDNPNSHTQLQAFFDKQGILDWFKKQDGYSFDKQQLKDLAHRSPCIRLLSDFKKVQAILKDVLLQSSIVGCDGRVHPDHKQMEVVTGRQSCAKPNLLGLPGVLRPLIIAPEGYGICEADYSQIEIAITAAVYGDENLIAKFNQGDIYSAMAQDFFKDSLSPEDQVANSDDFKHKHKDKRDVMKQCTLGIIYGLSAHGLAIRLKITEEQAQLQMDKFLAMFPILKQAMHTQPQYGFLRGYVSTATGLQRHVSASATPYNTRKWMVNMPVQGTAAALFKVAGCRLRNLYKAYDTKIILAVHDAFVFEAPLENLKEMAELTEQVMIQVIMEYYPQLKPRVDLNYSCPSCWTKDGDDNSVENWLTVTR